MRRPPSPPILRTPLAVDILGGNTYVPPEIPDDQRTGRDAALKNPAQATVLFNRVISIFFFFFFFFVVVLGTLYNQTQKLLLLIYFFLCC